MSTTLTNLNVPPSDTFINIIIGGITDIEDRKKVSDKLMENADLMKLGGVMDDTMSSFMNHQI